MLVTVSAFSYLPLNNNFLLKLNTFNYDMIESFLITEHVEDIVALLFKYIQLLQQSGACKWIFDEVGACA